MIPEGVTVVRLDVILCHLCPRSHLLLWKGWRKGILLIWKVFMCLHVYICVSTSHRCLSLSLTFSLPDTTATIQPAGILHWSTHTTGLNRKPTFTKNMHIPYCILQAMPLSVRILFNKGRCFHRTAASDMKPILQKTIVVHTKRSIETGKDKFWGKCFTINDLSLVVLQPCLFVYI